MAAEYGTAYSSTDTLAKAPGTSVDAGIRRFRNVFNFADAGVGGTTTPLIAAKLPAGSMLESAKLGASVDVSGINISVGIAGTTAKYSALAAGPNATRTSLIIKSSALDDDPLAAEEIVILTPSGNWPAAGVLVSDIFASKR